MTNLACACANIFLKGCFADFRNFATFIFFDDFAIPFFIHTFAAETREDPFEGNVVDKAPTLSMSFPCLARQLVDLPDGRVRVIFEKLK